MRGRLLDGMRTKYNYLDRSKHFVLLLYKIYPMNRLLLILLFLPLYSQAQVNIITTIAGNGTAAYSGDNGIAVYAQLSSPDGLCLDKFGNIYIADYFNNRIRKITVSTGIITTIAGNGTGAYYGDGGPATNAMLYLPDAVITDTAGNVYIGDCGNYRVRKITESTGIITTIVGTGSLGSSGDGGPATNAQISKAVGLYFDRFGNLFIADLLNGKIRKVDASGIITTFAGTTPGYSGDNGPATNAQIEATSIYPDTLNNMYIADQYNHVIRRVDAITGIITTIAGTHIAGYSGDNGPATNAQLYGPRSIYVDKYQNIFIGDQQAYGAIRKIDMLTGIITTVAGNGTSGYSGDYGPATNAQLTCGYVFLDDSGTIYLADVVNHAIRKVSICTGTPMVASYTDTGSHTVGFTYTGTTKYLNNVVWHFGDGDSSNLLNPIHTYTATGEYHVCVTVYTGCGWDTVCHDVNVTCISPPVVSFSDTGTAVKGFTYTGTTAGMDSVRWNFGDGSTDTVLNPIHTYTASGTYHVCVRVYTSCGSDSACSEIALGVPLLGAAGRGSVQVWPNPVKEQLTVAGARGSELCIYDMVGREIYKGFIYTNKESISIEFLQRGVYVVQVVDGVSGLRVMKKVVKE